jgi:hypothetical protein
MLAAIQFQIFLFQNEIKIYITVILLIVLNGCGTWSLTLRKEQRLRIRANRVLRGIFGHKEKEVT